MDDGPRILDCLEFDDDLRFGDVLNDVAFLAMDLGRLGHPELGERFLDDYRRLSGQPLARLPGTALHGVPGARACQGGLHPRRPG